MQALAVSHVGEGRLWLTNLSASAQTVRVVGLKGAADLLSLDEDSFEQACRDADWRNTAPRTKLDLDTVTLRPYAVAELRCSGF